MYQVDVIRLLVHRPKNQRWGQAICNQYGLTGPIADLIFHERDINKVNQAIREYFLDNQIPLDRHSL